LSVVNGRNTGFFTMRSAAIGVLQIVVRLEAFSRFGIGIASREHAILDWQSLGAGKSSEVAVEGTILLHDDDNVFYFVNACTVSLSGFGKGWIQKKCHEACVSE